MKAHTDPQEFFVAGGTLWQEAPSYIVRPADDELFRLTLGGEYCNVLAARQMGKSSLMVSTATRLQAKGIRTAILDISVLGGGISTAEAWFFGFLDELSVQLGLDIDVDAWWEAHASHNAAQLFNNFLRDVVLVNIPDPIVVFVDEIDSALGMAFTDDFFASIRAAYNARASQSEFQRLTFVLLGVARPADLIRDRNRTPYNIGVHVLLSDFTFAELQPFQSVFEAVYPGLGSDIITWVLEWTNGQPYLTQKLCAELIQVTWSCCTAQIVAEIVRDLFFGEEARKESNLRAIRDRLESSPHKVKMLQIYDQILRGQSVLDEERSLAKTELKLTGLVTSVPQGVLEVRNRIYRTVFDQDWVRKNLPRSRTRQVAILASLLAILAFIVAGYALYRQRIQPAQTFNEQFLTSNSPDVKLTSLARLMGLDERSKSEALDLFNNLSQAERLDLFAGLSSPQNVATELVTVIEAVYQDNPDNTAGNEMLRQMKTVLGEIGATGSPSLKSEIEYWLTARQDASLNQDARIAVSFFDSAFAESMARGHPNYAVVFERALTLIDLHDYPAAFNDLQEVWRNNPARQTEIVAAIQENPALAAYYFANPSAEPAILAFITRLIPTATIGVTSTSEVTSVISTAPTVSPIPIPSATAVSDQISPYNGWIAYNSGRTSVAEIMLLNPETGNPWRVTYNDVLDEAPSFSADDWNLVYASYRSQSGWELYAYDLHKSIEVQLTALSGESRYPDWSPLLGDARIVFERRLSDPEPAFNIWMLDTASGALTQLTSGGADTRPRWSPDGSQILFARATEDTTRDGRISPSDANDLYLLDLVSGETKNLTNTPDYDDFGFTWSPDGKRIAFTSVRNDVNKDGVVNLNDSQDLFTIGVDGKNERRLDLQGKPVYTPTWSPDGRTILVVVTEVDGQTTLWRYEIRSGKFAPLTEPGGYYHPDYSNLP